MKFIEFMKKNKNAGEGKDSSADKVFMRSVVMSFIAMIICIIVLSTSTYAWFVESVESNETIQSSVYKLTVTAEPQDKILVSEGSDGSFTYRLLAGVEYTVTVHSVDDGTTNGKTGYFKLAVGDKTYCSEQIDRGETISFSLTFSSDTAVTLVEYWGYSSIPDADRNIVNGDNLVDMIK